MHKLSLILFFVLLSSSAFQFRSINEEETKLSIQRRDDEKKVDDSDLDPLDLKEFEEKKQSSGESKKEEEKDDDDDEKKEKSDEETKKPVSESDKPDKEIEEEEKEAEKKGEKKEEKEETSEASPTVEEKEEPTSTVKVSEEDEVKSPVNESTTVFDEQEVSTTTRPTIRKTYFKSIVLLHLRPENITEEESKAIVYKGKDRINSSLLEKLLNSALNQRNETSTKRLYSLDLLIDKTQQHWFDLLRDFFL